MTPTHPLSMWSVGSGESEAGSRRPGERHEELWRAADGCGWSGQDVRGTADRSTGGSQQH